LGEYYEQLLELAIKRMTALIEPVMILVIGSMVGFVYYAFFQALFSLAGG
jgi:type IV pilus assembly protein PilC